MGVEIRRVPVGWVPPQRERGGTQPQYDSTFEEAAKAWLDGLEAWQRGERPTYFNADAWPSDLQFWEYEGMPPDREYYRPDWSEDEMVGWCVYETVSEGTPVTPAFATQDELIEYLVANGDYWDQNRRADGRSMMPCDPWPRDHAERFVRGPGWAPSLVFTPERGVESGVAFMSRTNPNGEDVGSD